ncbi:hypothetical protein L6164_018455 [Bauhinia variegata]|uniref:Uncharacterized protein n=1 Tax=Bauhinia variegata TaxID=167791 RepID=A0ACB9NCN2_BAUVA|nr:hypothetical protein L6164_018455 [Bauhinia variegata]
MAEMTELFPVGKLFERLPTLYDYTITIDLTSSIVFCVLVIFFFRLMYHILHGLFFWYVENEVVQEDLEGGITSAYPSSHQLAIFQALVGTNPPRAWRIVGGLERVFKVKRGQRLRDSNKLPPLVNYGSHDEVVKNFGDCAICLEDFKVGEFCQVFPECKHIFHSNCIDFWLQKKLTCPICRSYIED